MYSDFVGSEAILRQVLPAVARWETFARRYDSLSLTFTKTLCNRSLLENIRQNQGDVSTFKLGGSGRVLMLGAKHESIVIPSHEGVMLENERFCSHSTR